MNNVQYLAEYDWILNEKHLKTLQFCKKDVYVMTNKDFVHTLTNSKIHFRIGISNNSYNEYTTFKLEITKLPSQFVCNGRFVL